MGLLPALVVHSTSEAFKVEAWQQQQLTFLAAELLWHCNVLLPMGCEETKRNSRFLLIKCTVHSFLQLKWKSTEIFKSSHWHETLLLDFSWLLFSPQFMSWRQQLLLFSLESGADCDQLFSEFGFLHHILPITPTEENNVYVYFEVCPISMLWVFQLGLMITEAFIQCL